MLLVIKDKNNIEFLKDATSFLLLKHPFEFKAAQDIWRNDFEDRFLIENLIYKYCDKTMLKQLFKIGQSQYNITIGYEHFFKGLFEGYRTSGHWYYFRLGRHSKPSKYQKKATHVKKEIDESTLNKKEWREKKKPKRDIFRSNCYSGWRRECREMRFEYKCLKEKIWDMELEEELKNLEF